MLNTDGIAHSEFKPELIGKLVEIHLIARQPKDNGELFTNVTEKVVGTLSSYSVDEYGKNTMFHLTSGVKRLTLHKKTYIEIYTYN